MRDIPNILTVLRILLIPVFVICFYLEGVASYWMTAIIFAFASITDYLDGYLARLLKAESTFGRVIDPIADKVLVSVALMMLVHFERAPIIPAILILSREVIVSGLREYLAEFQVSIPVTNLAKIKTAIQLISVIVLLAGNEVFDFKIITLLGEILIWIAALLTLVTGYAYFKEGLYKMGVLK
jgi:cardiolipin synthase